MYYIYIYIKVSQLSKTFTSNLRANFQPAAAAAGLLVGRSGAKDRSRLQGSADSSCARPGVRVGRRMAQGKNGKLPSGKLT